MTQKYSAVNYLLYLLSKREYSQHELKQKLSQKEYSLEEIEQALEKAIENKWQSDERFCTMYIRYRANQGYGPRCLKQELYQKGIKDWLISQEIENSEIDWFEIAERIFEKKCPQHWDIKAKQKMWRFMTARGFYSEHFNYLLDLNIDYDNE